MEEEQIFSSKMEKKQNKHTNVIQQGEIHVRNKTY